MFKLALSNIFRRKQRTFLALLGIVVGVAAIMSLVSVVDGVFLDVSNVFSSIQGIRVTQRGGSDPIFNSISLDWEQKIDLISGVKKSVPFIQGQLKSIDGKNPSNLVPNARIGGYDIVKNSSAGNVAFVFEIIKGRHLKPGDKGAVVIGKQLAEDFDKFVGNKINLNGESFEIVGIYEAPSSFLNYGVWMDLSDARTLLNFPFQKVTGFVVGLNNPDEAKKISDLFNFRFSESEAEAFTLSDLSSLFGDFINSFRLIVFFVAGISGIVAGIGIMNTVLMSVFERFQEIGALKAIGWTNQDIIFLILLESLFVGVIGGILGILFGSFISFALSFFFALKTAVTIFLILQVFFFAVIVGVLSGIYPAFVAAKMDPVEALRYE